MTLLTTTRQRKASRPGNTPAVAAGFTLVEMLVVIVIMLVLMSVTVTVINISLDGERVRSGSRQMQSLLMGARDRAIHQQLPRGVRFEIDPSSPQSRPLVRSMIYIGASQNWSQGSVSVHRNPNNNGLPDLIRGEFTEWFVLRYGEDLPGPQGQTPNGTLDSGEDRNGNTLLDLGPLVDGARIKLGSRWYTITTTSLLSVNDQWLRISPPLVDPQPTDEPYPAIPTRPIAARFADGDYEMTLQPRVLANSQPLQLPAGVVLDLSYCRLPNALWLQQGYRYRDILFSPRGSVIGSTAAAGVIHLLLNDQVDCIAGRAPWVAGNEGDKRVVSLFTRTGNVSTSELFPGEVALGIDINQNGSIDAAGPRNLYYYAEVGEVSE